MTGLHDLVHRYPTVKGLRGREGPDVMRFYLDSMKGNLVFYNISETDGEDCREVVDNFIRNVLKVPNQYIFSPDNVLGEVCVDVAHRIKHTKSDRSRPIVARLTSHRGRNRVLSFSKSLKSTPYALSEQLPPNIREKRRAQIPTLIEMRNRAKVEKRLLK